MLRKNPPFRAAEVAEINRRNLIRRYTRGLSDSHADAAVIYIDQLIERFGPVVTGYPSWHPFTFRPSQLGTTYFEPQSSPYGFEGLDHTHYFRDAFITAPFGKAGAVVKSAYAKEELNPVGLVAEKIDDILLYHKDASPVLVYCADIPKESDGTIEKRYVLGKMLETELPGWENAQCGESWEDMQPHILGSPHGTRSSLFVNQTTGAAAKEIFDLLNRHELWGPLRRRE